MDPVSLVAVGAMYAATAVARKASDDLVDETWGRIKDAFKRVFGSDTSPATITAPEVATLAAATPEVQQALERLWLGSAVLRRASLAEKALKGARLLWIDDNPAGNSTERQCFNALGMTVTTVETTESALACLANEEFDLILSDIDREGSNRAGLDALRQLNEAAPKLPIVLYIAALEPRGVPHGAFGITYRPDELLHLCMDVVERRRL